MLDFSQFHAISFDCYGTLIDWETGILGALRPVLERQGIRLADDEILKIYGQIEPGIQQSGYQKYRDVLQAVVRGFGERLGFTPSEDEVRSLPDSLKNWPPFPDTVAALRELKKKYKLAIISNTDDALFAESAKLLQVPFDFVITAEQAGAYKPSEKPFELALKKIGLPREQVLHAGQSVYHDVVPARSLGLKTVLVHRRGFGATRPVNAKPDLEVPDMSTLAEKAGAA